VGFGPKHKSPIPNPQSPIPRKNIKYFKYVYKNKVLNNIKIKQI
jgi:hypothetical protein